MPRKYFDLYLSKALLRCCVSKASKKLLFWQLSEPPVHLLLLL
jgi:hypothetical protein